MDRKLGRRPSDPVRLRRMIRLRLTGVLPDHPLTADHLSAVKNWMMGANDQFGTCGPTSVANALVLTYKALQNEDITVSDEDVFDLYRRSGNPNFNPNTGADDNGVDMTVMLDALLKGGIWITHQNGARELVKPICYASLATDMDTQRTATSIFGLVLWGVDLQVAQQNQSVWDYKPSGEWGGHAIPGGAFTSRSGSGELDESIVSWQQVYGTTDSFAAHQLQESYIPIFPLLWANPAFQAGVDQTTLAADYKAVTGRDFPVPVNPPNPPQPPQPPPPAPNPSPGCFGALAGIGLTLAGLPR